MNLPTRHEVPTALIADGRVVARDVGTVPAAAAGDRRAAQLEERELGNRYHWFGPFPPR